MLLSPLNNGTFPIHETNKDKTKIMNEKENCNPIEKRTRRKERENFNYLFIWCIGRLKAKNGID